MKKTKLCQECYERDAIDGTDKCGRCGKKLNNPHHYKLRLRTEHYENVRETKYGRD